MNDQSVRAEALRAFVRRPAFAPLTAFGDWNPDLHPRGHDGKFIDVLGLIDLIDMPGFRHGQRGDKKVQGEVTAIIPDPDDPGNPTIRVRMTDPRWDASAFGEHFDARSYQVSAREPAKAKIPTSPVDLSKELLPEEPTPIPTVMPPIPTTYPAHIPPTTGIGEPLSPMVKTDEWDSLSPLGKQMWIQAQMEADLTAFRGTPTVFNLDGTDPEVGFNLANRYRELTGIDPKTAAWVDGVVTNKTAHTMSDELVKPTPAIAVAHPGTKHPGGIGPITNRKAIVLNEKHFMDSKTWAKEKAMSSSGSFPWSVGSEQGDYTATMVHEFGHHRQFRYLAETMLEVGQPFSKVKHEDGFGLMPDSSNWPEVQAARYEIQKLAPSQYGKSKTSEAFAEVWAGVTTGYVPISPELQSAWDTWHLGMEIPSQMPPDRFTPDELVDYESLLPEEKAEYWAGASALLELPGMREHYPETAAIYDAWAARTVYAANPNERKLGNGLVMRLSDSSEGRGTIEVRKDGDGELVGRLHWNLSGISHIGVTPDHQRQGIATAMYRWARELDPDLKHGMVVSETARSWIDTLNPEEREQVGRPETKFVGETPAPALMAPSASSNERSAKLAEKVADWLPKWKARQEKIGYNTMKVGRYTVLDEIIGKNLWSSVDPKITADDEVIVQQVQYIVESGITPEQLREQAAQLRKAVLT